MIESFTMKFYLPFILWIALLVNITHPFHVSRSGRGLLKKVATRLNIHAFDNEEALTQLLNSYDFRGAYDFVKKDPMLKISKDNAIKLLNNLQKLEPEPPSSSQADQSKKGTESCSLIYRRLEKQKVLRGFNCLGNVYPEPTSEISPTKLESITGLPLNALTPRTRTTYWRLAGITICVLELILGFYFGIDPVFTLIPITIFAFVFDQIALKGAIFETIYRGVFPEYKKKVITHEAGHLLVAYLLGLPIRGVVTSAWDARKYPEIQGSAGTIFFDEKFSEELESQKVTRTSLDRLSVAFMAGIAAEAIQFGVCEGGAADEKSLISLFTSISPPWNILRIQGQARWAVAQCILLLREHQDSFNAVIKALEQEKELGEIIFDIEKNLPVELPSARRLEEKQIQRKEKDRELLFRMIQRKIWNVGGIQPLPENLVSETDTADSSSLFQEQEPSKQQIVEEVEQDPVDMFAKRIELLQKAVQRGDLDINSKASGGLWLNDLRSLQKPSMEESIREIFQPADEEKKRRNLTTAYLQSSTDDMDVFQLLESHRGFLMKELELKEKETVEKLDKIEQRLSNYNGNSRK